MAFGPSQLPRDAVLLSLSSGALLVSREWAVFCAVAPSAVSALEIVLAGSATVSSLPADLQKALLTHGFFDQPRKPPPTHHTVQLQLTNACNLACSYCCTNSATARSEEVREQQLRKLLLDVRREYQRPVRVSLLGGEPFLVPWAIDLAEYALDLGLELGVFTNGTLQASNDGLARRTARLVKRGAEVRVSLARSGGPRWDLQARPLGLSACPSVNSTTSAPTK